ncbi:abnormal spindle-like microcephaly-associated protein [Pelodytes ibericus]
MLMISPPRAAMGRSPPDDTPVLSLTHFSRPPFVNFGCVRTGSSRSVQLLLYNPNQDPAQITVQKVPENRGFTVSLTRAIIESCETIPLTLTWTPLEEGGVRELVTFIVNDVVKHQAVLLGQAESPAKKKGNLRNTTKKRNVPFSKRKEIGMKGINRTAQKSVGGKLETMRSPLHSCENLGLPVNVVSPLREKQCVENRVPTLHLSPLIQEWQIFSPGSLRRSKTYSVLCTTEYCETLEEVTTTSKIQAGLHIDEEWTFTDQTPRKRSMSPINPAFSQPLNITCTPDVTVLSPCSALSPSEYYNTEIVKIGAQKSYDSPVENTGSFEESLQDSFIIASLPPHSPPTVLTPQRQILSPDSFVNNSFIPEEHYDGVQHTPILSPDQFVKENFISLQSLSPYGSALSKSSQLTSLTSSKDSVSPIQEEVKKGYLVSEPVDIDLSSHEVEEKEPASSRLTYCVKKKCQERAQLVETSRNVPKKPPVLSATVTKAKANNCSDGMSRPKLKSCRKLECIETETEKKARSQVFQSLPILTVSGPSIDSVQAKDVAPSKSVISGRKRKSDDFTRILNVEGTSEVNINTLTQAKRSHLSKPSLIQPKSNQEQQSQRKRAVTLALKSSGKVQHGSLKSKPALIKPYKTEMVGPTHPPSTMTFKNSKRVVAVAQSRLTFVKPTKTVIPRHPMPFAAKNMFYDERWMAKQERGFTWWLNFILTPDDFAVNTDSVKVSAAALILGEENIHRVSVPKAPTKDEVSLKAYTARCRLNRLRRAACRLFTSETMTKAIRRLEVEIEARRLLVRKDRHLWKDIGERQKILNWLLSYNPLWLRVGLETIFGELISLESNSDVTGLAVFILNRLLWNPDIGTQYRHPSVPHLYRDGHEEALSKFTLKKLLLLVFFLDHAKLSRLIDHDPCLFWKDAEFKTSKDLLLAFSRDFLSGEGDLSRHLGYLGLPVSHVQTPLDEFDFAVTNLAVDLHCGIRLVRTMELLTQNWSLSRKLRVPAISRLQKMHNVEVALQVLTERGVQIKDERGITVTSKDIVDRHRERTLALLWRIVFTFQVDVLLSIKQLKEEIGFLRRSYSTQKKLAALRSFTGSENPKKRESDPFTPENYNERMLLLLEWVNAVCAFYSTKVENFTVSFSDGRVFCYLINHYHPSYLPLSAVCQRTTQTIECTDTGTVGLNSSSDSDSSLDLWPGMCDQGYTTSTLYKELLENERTNYTLVHGAVSNLGGIPAMIHHSDMSNTIPDEKIVITYLSFLCARLLDLRQETKAARVIQAAWRKYRLKAEELLQQRKHKAACTIKAAIVRFVKKRRLKKVLAAVVIQKYWRRYQAQKQFVKLKEYRLMETQAVIIQRYWRGCLARKHYARARGSVIFLQAIIRTKIAVAAYKRVLYATGTLQTYLHSWLLSKRQRQKYLQLKSAALVIQYAFKKWKREKLRRHTEAAVLLQRNFRKWRARKLLAQQTAAVTIQARYRMYKEKQKYQDVKNKIIKIQSWYRSCRQRQAFLITQKHIVTLQKYYRAYKQGRTDRAHYLLKRCAAISIQRWYRSERDRKVERETFLKTKRAIVTLQATYRGWKARNQMQKLNLAAICIQSRFRRLVAQRNLNAIKQAALVIQRHCRAVLAGRRERQRYLELCRAARKVQTLWRSKVLRERQRRHEAVILIQSFYRMHVCSTKYKMMIQACKLIQSHYKAYKAGKAQRSCYLSMKAAATVLQAACRGWKTRRQYQSFHEAASTIQYAYQSYRLRKRYITMRTAAVSIQRYYRATTSARLQEVAYIRLRVATITLQAGYRGMKVRHSIIEMHRASIIIQSWFRMHQMRAEYKEKKMAAVHIQLRYRALQTRKEVQKRYLSLKKAACVLQSAWRGKKTRKHVKCMHDAAAVIQAQYRMYIQNRYYKELKVAARTMQRRHRASVQRNNHVAQYKSIRNSALCIQTAFRAMKARQEVKARHKAASVIQRSVKAFLERRRFLVLRSSAVLIQHRYRMKVHATQQRQDFISLRKAAIVLQAAYRGLHVRRAIQRMHVSVTVIQAAFRARRARNLYQKIKRASVIIQRWYRRQRMFVCERKWFLKQRQSAVVIQAAYRGAIVRQGINRMNKAATKIQAAFRMYQGRNRYCNLQWAVCIIQQRYRANKMRDFEVMRYSFMKESAVCIQTAYRAWCVRKEKRRLNQAAVVIQRFLRTVTAHKRYLSVKAAAVVIQRRYRALVLAREHHRTYQALLRAAVFIQASYRGFKARQELSMKRTMAMKIQATFRMHRTQRSYQAMRSAACVIQAWYRSIGTCRRHRTGFLKLRQSTILVQAAYRGMRVRRDVRAMYGAACTIQSYYRMHHNRHCYNRILLAVRKIQQRFRETRARNSEQEKYQNTRKATVLLQAAFRGMKVRKEIQRMHQSAVLIQRCFKAHKQRKTYMTIQCATVTIQRRYRSVLLGRSQRHDFLALRKATVCVQAAYRGFKVRKDMEQCNKAATEIQSMFRMHRQYIKYKAMKLAATCIQTYYRNHVTARCERARYLQLCNASVVIQAAYKGMRTRKNLRAQNNAATAIQACYRMCSVYRIRKAAREAKKNAAAQVIQASWKMHRHRTEFVKTKVAAVIIQSRFRGYKTRTQYKEMQSAACVIQRWYRRSYMARLQRAQYLTMRRAATAIQSAFRRMRDRHQTQTAQAARKLQSFLRMAVCRKRFLRVRAATVKLQSFYRMYTTKCIYRRKKEAALIIQRWYKSYVAMKHQRESYSETRRSIICLQAAIRGYRERQILRRMKCSALKIQAFWRSSRQRRIFLQYKTSAVIIQQRYHAWRLQRLERDQYLKLKMAATRVQAVYRGSSARRILRRERAACVIQSYYKRYTTRRDYITLIATVRTVQGFIRMKQERARFLRVQRATVCIQRRWRETVIAKTTRQMFLRKQAAALQLQSVFRGQVVRRGMLKKQKAACIIQAAYKGRLVRQRFLKLKAATERLQAVFRAVLAGRHAQLHYGRVRNSVITLQACARGWLVRNEIAHLKRQTHLLRFTSAVYHHLSAVKIQRCFRAHLALKRAQKQMNHVICIQRWFRSKLQHRKFLITRHKVVKLQRTVRAWLHRRNEAALKIQRCARDFISRRRQAKVMSGIVKFQGLWRGYTFRKTHDTKAIKALRKRLQIVNQETKEEDKLYRRTSVALEYLLSYKHLSYILAALQHLEVATRLSALCCENMAHSGAVKTIFTLIRSCNRSIPCMEVIKLSVQVLLNLSKYDGTVQVVYHVNKSVDVLLDLMQIYREKAGDKVSDKGGSIFTKTCCLLAIFALNSQRAQEIRSTPKVLDRIRSIYKLTCRKHKMDTERNISKQRLSASVLGNVSMQATPIRTRVVSRIKPDWVLRKDNMREIVDPLKAIRMVMDTLGMAV